MAQMEKRACWGHKVQRVYREFREFKAHKVFREFKGQWVRKVFRVRQVEMERKAPKVILVRKERKEFRVQVALQIVLGEVESVRKVHKVIPARKA